MICDCYEKGHRKCQCGATVDGVVKDGTTIRVPLFLRDSASHPEKDIRMMNDAEKRTMRDSVRGMPLSQAKDLPIYDDFKSFWNNGMPANELAALHDGAIVEPRQQSADEARVEAYRDHMIDSLSNAHRAPVNDNHSAGPVHTKDGRLVSDLPEHERAHHQMTHDISNAWKQ